MINLKMSDPLSDQYFLSPSLSLLLALYLFFSRKLLLCINAPVNKALASTLLHQHFITSSCCCKKTK